MVSLGRGLDKTDGMVYNIMVLGMWPSGKALGLEANHHFPRYPGRSSVFSFILAFSPVFGRMKIKKCGLTAVLTTIEYFYRGMAQLVERVLWEQITAVPQTPGKVQFSRLFSHILTFSGVSNVKNES